MVVTWDVGRVERVLGLLAADGNVNGRMADIRATGLATGDVVAAAARNVVMVTTAASSRAVSDSSP